MATILVVDDSPMARRFLAKLLIPRGHQVLEARDGQEALGLLGTEQPDLIITDLLMPVMDGYEFIRHLRADSTLPQPPVIFRTAVYLEREAQRLAHACGVVHLLTDLSGPDVLLETVDEALGLAPPPRLRVPAEEFTREHRRVLSNKLAQKVHELEGVNTRLGALIELGLQLALERDASRLLATFCHAARTIFGSQHAAVGLLAPDRQTWDQFLVSEVSADRVVHAGVPAPTSGLLAQLLAEGRPLRLGALDSPSEVIGLPLDPSRVHFFLGTPIASPAQLYGLLYLTDRLDGEEFSEADERLVRMLAAQLAVVYENARRYDEIQHREEALKALSHQLMEAQETERRRIAIELHDEIGQAITTLRLNLYMVQRNTLGPADRAVLQESVELLDRTLQQVRELSLDLRPSLLDDLGLLPALRWYVDRQAQRAGMVGQVRAAPLANRLPATLETVCFRVVQEAMTNVVRHAQARRVAVTLRTGEGEVVLAIRDDGVGFDVGAALVRSAGGSSMGLLGMQERVRLAGGQLEIHSRSGSGTEIRAHLPLPPS